MSEYDNNMSGALFRNDKGDNPKRPDYKGNAEIDGIQYWISGWIQTSKSGAKYMSLKFQAKNGAEKTNDVVDDEDFVF